MKLDDKIKNYISSALIGIAIILVYFILPYLEVPLLNLFNVEYQDMSTFLKIIYLLSFEFLLMAIILLIGNKKLKQDINDIKINHKNYFSKYFKYWLISLGVMMISNVFITLITGNDTSNNEEAIRSLFKISPIYVYIASVICAPIIEEMVFRRGIRNIIPSNSNVGKLVYILTSGLIFGGLHIVNGYSGVTDLLYLIPYCSPGIAFAYMLTKTDNIFVSMGLHFMHNGILISLQFILLIFS